MFLPLLRRRGPTPGAWVVREGVLHGGLPYLAVGQGPPLVVFSGFTAEHANPTGAARRFSLQPLRPLARHFTVYLVNRKPGVQPGSTIADLAGHYAQALERAFTGPVALMGISTGGSIAQQFAIDHPQLVRRLVLVASACRLGPGGRRMQRELARFTLAGQPRRAWAATGPELATTTVGSRLYAALLWLAGPKMHPEDPSDMLVVTDAEDRFNAAPGLHRITAPTLVIAGDRDRNYTPELFRETAEGIPGARLRLYPGKGHASIAMLTHKPAVREILGFLTDQPTPPHITEHNGAGNTEEPVGKAEADEVCCEPLDLPVTMPKVPANQGPLDAGTTLFQLPALASITERREMAVSWPAARSNWLPARYQSSPPKKRRERRCPYPTPRCPGG